MVIRGDRALDEVQEQEFRTSGLRGDRWVDENAALPVRPLAITPGTGPAVGADVAELVLDGEWLVTSCEAEPPIRDMPLKDWTKVVFDGVAGHGLRSGWHRPGADRSEWTALRVPGTVQSSMIEKGLLEDPYWDTNTYDELVEHGSPSDVPFNMRTTRIEQREWWYATTFELPAALRGERLTLSFDGIDYAASIYLNGRSLGHSAGMFGGPDRDVTGVVDPDGENTLVVRVFPPPSTWFGILKGNPGWGWHYGHLISVGIWQSVRVRATPAAEGAELFVWSPESSAERAVVRVQLDVRSDSLDPTMLDAGIVLVDPDGTETAYRGSLVAQTGTTRWAADIEVSSPRRWWPRGWGEQPLYRARVALAATDGSPVGPLLETSFGIRSIEMTQQNLPVSESDYRWTFVVNGVPLFVKGANWCWTDPTNGPDSSRAVFLEQAVDAGVQMLRAWGGGIIESTEFYEFCDREGILVYQEFPYSWGPPDAPDTDLAVLDDQVRRVVQARRNHPSLIMWGGGNENYEHPGADEGLILVGRRCRQFDPSRPYHRTDPWGGSAHNYRVYHEGWPMDSGYLSMDSVFYGEFGLPSMPGRRSSERMLPASALASWPPSAESHGVIAHLHQFQLFDLVKALRYCHYGPVRSWDDYIEYGQLAQGDALRFAAERQRAGVVDGSKTGFWFYKLTELFPGHSWGVLDFWGARKDSYYRAKQVLRPRALFATYDRFDWSPGDEFVARIFAADDTDVAWHPGAIVAELYDRELRPIVAETFDVGAIAANTTTRVGELALTVPGGRVPALLGVRRADGDVEADSWYWFNFLEKTDRMREIESRPISVEGGLPTDRESETLIRAYVDGGGAPLRELPAAALEVVASGRRLTIRNSGPVPAFNIHVRGRERDVRVSDSGFSLAPGGLHHVVVQDGGPPDVVVTAWNVPSGAVERVGS